MAFTAHADAAFDVCFENQLNAKRTFRDPRCYWATLMLGRGDYESIAPC